MTSNLHHHNFATTTTRTKPKPSSAPSRGTTSGNGSRRDISKTVSATKNLRAISLSLVQKLRSVPRGIPSTEIANQLAKEAVRSVVGTDTLVSSADLIAVEKNIRRRLYDSLKVLVSIGAIRRSRADKMLHWQGVTHLLPSSFISSSSTITTTTVINNNDNNNLVNNQMITQLQNTLTNTRTRLDDKAILLQQLMQQKVALERLCRRNRRIEQQHQQQQKIYLPFVVVRTPHATKISLESTPDTRIVTFHFSDNFELVNDAGILDRLFCVDAPPIDDDVDDHHHQRNVKTPTNQPSTSSAIPQPPPQHSEIPLVNASTNDNDEHNLTSSSYIHQQQQPITNPKHPSPLYPISTTSLQTQAQQQPSEVIPSAVEMVPNPHNSHFDYHDQQSNIQHHHIHDPTSSAIVIPHGHDTHLQPSSSHPNTHDVDNDEPSTPPAQRILRLPPNEEQQTVVIPQQLQPSTTSDPLLLLQSPKRVRLASVSASPFAKYTSGEKPPLSPGAPLVRRRARRHCRRYPVPPLPPPPQPSSSQQQPSQPEELEQPLISITQPPPSHPPPPQPCSSSISIVPDVPISSSTSPPPPILSVGEDTHPNNNNTNSTISNNDDVDDHHNRILSVGCSSSPPECTTKFEDEGRTSNSAASIGIVSRRLYALPRGGAPGISTTPDIINSSIIEDVEEEDLVGSPMVTPKNWGFSASRNISSATAAAAAAAAVTHHHVGATSLKSCGAVDGRDLEARQLFINE